MKIGPVRALALVLLFLQPVLAISAHPHVFIDCRAALILDGDKVAGFHLVWTFDEMFSQMILADYDRAGKGSFSPTEAEEIRKGAFNNLRNYHYFLAFYVDGIPDKAIAIRDFRPSIHDGRLVYEFTVPLALTVPPSGRELRVTVYDDTYYTAFDKMVPRDVSVPDSDSIATAVSIEKTKAKATWPGQWMPDQIVLRLKRK